MIAGLTRLRVALVCSLLLALFAISPGYAQQSAPAINPLIDPDAKTVLDRMSAYFKGLKSFSVDNTISTSHVEGASKEAITLDYHIAVARPDKLSIILSTNKSGVSLFRNGQALSLYLPQTGRYTRAEVNSSLSDTAHLAIFRGPSIFLTFAMALLSDDPEREILDGVTEVKYVGVEDLNGEKNAHIKFIEQDVDFDIWIAAGEHPTLTKAVPDFTRGLAMSSRQPGDPQESFNAAITYANWTLDAEIPATRFAFNVPAGASEVDSLPQVLGIEEDPPSPLLGKPAPQLPLDLLNGGKFDLAQYKGKNVVVLDFWATWCGPCRKGLPILSKVTTELKDQGVVFFAVNLGEDKEAVQAFLKNEGLNINVALDTQTGLGNLYLVQPIPQTVLIGKDGTVQVVHIGVLPGLEMTLRKQLKKLLSGESYVAPSSTKPQA